MIRLSIALGAVLLITFSAGGAAAQEADYPVTGGPEQVLGAVIERPQVAPAQVERPQVAPAQPAPAQVERPQVAPAQPAPALVAADQRVRGVEKARGLPVTGGDVVGLATMGAIAVASGASIVALSRRRARS